MLGIALVAAVHGLSACFNILAAPLNIDEGFYGVASRAASHGEWPYRDFGYTQTPLLPFVNGVLMRLWGFGLFAQRMTNALWVAGALALALWLVGRRTRLGLGLLLVLSFSLLAPWMGLVHLGKTYAFSTLIAVAAAAVFVQGHEGQRRQWGLSVLVALGVGTRLPLAPYFLVLWIAALVQGRPARALSAVAGLLLCLSLVFLPFFLADRESFVFWIFQFHADSAPSRGYRLNGIDVLTLAPALWLAVAVVLLARRGRESNREVVLLGAALVGTAANLASPGAYAEYITPLLLPLAIAALLLVESQVSAWSVWRRRLFAMALVLAQVAVAPLANFMTSTRRHTLASWWLTPSMHDYDPHLRQRNAIIRDLVARYLPAGAPLFGPNLIPALELGRPVPTNLAMGPFSVTRELPPDQAHRLHLCTDADLLAYVSDPRVTVISFADRGIMNYGWSMPSFSGLPAGVTPGWSQIVLRDFVPAMRARNYVILVRRSSLGTGPTSAR